MQYFVLIILFVTNSLCAHDLHVSVCDIELQDETVEITFKTFLDDLQLAMGLHPGEELPETYTSAEEMIENYIQSSIRLDIDGEEKQLKIETLDASQESVWITMVLNVNNTSPKQLQIESTFLTEVYNDQTNIINLKKGDKKKSFILNKKKNLVNYEI